VGREQVPGLHRAARRPACPGLRGRPRRGGGGGGRYRAVGRRRADGPVLSEPLALTPGAPWYPTAEQETLLQACLLPAARTPSPAAWWRRDATMPRDHQSRSLLPFVY